MYNCTHCVTMKYFLLLCFCAVAYSASVTININGTEKMYYDIDEAEELFEQFIANFEKNYESEEEKLMRFEIFKKSLQVINDRNVKHDTIHGITAFTDLTSEEFAQRYGTGLLQEEQAMPCQKIQLKRLSSLQVASSLDWRERNVVTPIKDQSSCGSCWAHSIIGCLESQWAMKHGQLLDLSEQQLLDCEPTNGGCAIGGLPSNGGIYLIENGAMLESDYPYVNAKRNCAYDARKAYVKPSQCIDFQGTSENELMAILNQYGPIAVGIDSTALVNYHQFYNGGVIPNCVSNKCGHAVMLIGYNTASAEGPHWILKNSWGTGWGDQGFFKIPLGSRACKISECTMTGLQL